jgi:peptide/nickel transport system substrate-binding protein
MDWPRVDRARQNATPLELDLVEAYAQKRISRRNFVKRGTIIGLSVPFMGGIIAACGGDDDDDDDGGSTSTQPPADGDTSTATTAPAAPTQGGDITAATQFGDANSGLDPLNMLDLGTYAHLSQSFEYLVGLGSDGNIAPTALATGWSPNADGSVWTFELREGVTWHDGTPFTSADVAATVERMVVAGAGLAGVVGEGAVDASDPTKAVITLEKPNGNLPVLISIYNPQSLITPADYSDGTTLDARPAGTGAFMFDTYDATTFVTRFVPNPNWWGGSVNVDSVTLKGFESGGTAVAAFQAGEIDMVQSFNVVDGGQLLEDSAVTVLTPPSANHRQLWFNTQLPEDGPYSDPRVRQAIGYCLNREQMVATLYEGQGIVANDHPVHPSLPFFDASAVEQRPRDIEMAKQLMSDAGYPDGIESVLQVGNLQEIPEMAAIVEQNCAEAGFKLSVAVTDNSDFYGEYWCAGAEWGAQPETGGPGRPCGASAEIGIVDYGHRPTPDVYFGRALETDGDWNSSNYASAEFDKLFTDYQASVDVEGQTTAVSAIQQLLHTDTPACYPIWFNYLSAHTSDVSGVEVTALGHMQFQNATKA